MPMTPDDTHALALGRLRQTMNALIAAGDRVYDAEMAIRAARPLLMSAKTFPDVGDVHNVALSAIYNAASAITRAISATADALQRCAPGVQEPHKTYGYYSRYGTIDDEEPTP